MDDHVSILLFAAILCGSIEFATNYQHDDHHNDDFLIAAQKEIDEFHRFIYNHEEDQDLAASHHSKKGKGHAHSGKSASEKTGHSKKTGSKKHHEEKSNKLNSIKDKHEIKWSEKKGKDTKKKKEHHHQDEHHGGEHNDAREVFKDAHKHNKGNYQKGFNEKYHLDEVKKHRKYWNNADAHKKWKTFGQHGSESEETEKKNEKAHAIKEGGSGSKDSKKKKSSKKSQSASKHGHKKVEGKKVAYQHEKHYHKKD
ncbi:uncharacterized protein LOC111046562 [Nilaparvata lugens]|uniref:uncharacterized protein LOC111046562 n=1 Tax=Nilaparvata lugens TaxID=108931 RepID=UPI000B9933CA|nr:uncharacterized protein LOC111046562 [Nilaparvata lugens]